jgi:NAD(P)-dependent dehydrogenase (short-subunit alcohol dehydrogenase family)
VAGRKLNNRVVLVTDADQRAALAVVRSLGRAGHRMLVAGSRQRSLAGASRYCTAQLYLPDPLTEPAKYAEEVISADARNSVDTLIPISEDSLLAILSQRSRLGT